MRTVYTPTYVRHQSSSPPETWASTLCGVPFTQSRHDLLNPLFGAALTEDEIRELPKCDECARLAAATED